MASTDSRPVPIKNTAFRAVFPILDADGDLVTGATGLDSEVSKDQGTFTDCTNEATEIATSSGLYYLDLTSTEMNADCVAVIVKTSSSGAKTTVLVFYPEETGDINVDVTAFGGTALTASGGRPEVNVSHFGGSAGSFASGVPAVNATQISGDATAADNLESAFDDTVGANRWTGILDQGTAQAVTGTTIRLRSAAAFADDELNGCWVVITGGSTGVGQVRQITDYANSTDTATVDTWTTTPTGTITYQVLPGAMLAADVAKIASAAVNTSSAQLGVNVVNAAGTAWNSGAIGPNTLASDTIAAAKIATGAITNAKFAAGAIDAAAIANNAIDAATFAADVDAEILSYLVDDATRIDASALNTAAVTTIPAILTDTAEIGAAGAGLTVLATAAALTTVDGVVDAIKAETDKLADTLEDDGGTYRFTTNALEQAPGGGSGPSAADIADAVWDEDLTGHTTPDSAGDILGNVAVGTPPTAAAIADEVETRTIAGVTTVGTVNALAANSVNASALAPDAVTEIQSGLATSAELAKVPKSDSNVTWNATAAAQLQSEAADALNAYDAPTKAELDSAVSPLALQTSVDDLESRLGTPSNLGSGATVAANLADIEAQTDDIGTAGAGLTALATAAELAKVPKSDGTVGWNATARAQIQTEAEDALAAYDGPTHAELTSALASADDAVLAAIAALNNLSQANIRTALGLSSANLDTQLGDLPTNAELATALAAADDAVLAALAALNNLSAAQAQTAAAAALTAYDAPTRTEATSDKDEVLARLPAALVGGRMDATIDATGMEAGAIDALLDDTIGDGTLTVRQALRVLVAGMAGKLSGAATTTVTIRNAADSADVIVATVDADGNRSAVTVTP